MNRLENNLKNDSREEYRNLIAIPLSKLTELEDCSTFEELKNNYLIYANPFKIKIIQYEIHKEFINDSVTAECSELIANNQIRIKLK